MEAENCVDSVTDLACILEIFFNGLSECGLLSTYSVQLQTGASDMTVHLKFRQHVYQIMKSLQVLLQRISKIPGGKSISTDRATQTDGKINSESHRPYFRPNKIQKQTSKKMVSRATSRLPFHHLISSKKSTIKAKVRINSSDLPQENRANSCDRLTHSLQADTQSSSASHSVAAEDIVCTSPNLTCLSSSSNNPVVSSRLEYCVGTSGQLSPTESTLTSHIPPSILEVNESIPEHQVHSNDSSLINPSETSDPCLKNSIVASDILSTSDCTEFSSTNQMHSLETPPELVPQDLIAVLDTEDVSDQQEGAVLFLRPEDAGEDISHDDVEIQDGQLNNRSMPLEEDDGHQNIQQDSSLYSYSEIVEKEDSNSGKSIKGGIDIVSSLRNHEEELRLFCKDEVELDPINSVAVEVVEKDGELMSIFSPDNTKEVDDESSTVLYVNGDVLSSKKDIHLGNAITSKNDVAEHFFEKKIDSKNRKGSSFEIMGMKMDEEINSRGGSEDDTENYAERQCSREESCGGLPSGKEDRTNNSGIIGLESKIDPEDDLGQNFVYIVVTASQVGPEEAGERKIENVGSKDKNGKCTKETRNGEACSCSACDTTFPTLSSLQNHLKKKRGNFSQCDFCQKVFPTIGSLVDHCREVHDGVGCFECEECGKRLKSRLSLRRHQESHQGRKEAVCHECGKTFCRGDYLIRHHQMVHAGERPFQCNQCSQRFLSRGHLRNHLSVHTSERNHKCGICGKTFGRSDKLREHVLRHLSAKRHTCPTCGRSYADKRDLNKHQMREPACHSEDSGTSMAVETTNSNLELQSCNFEISSNIV